MAPCQKSTGSGAAKKAGTPKNVKPLGDFMAPKYHWLSLEVLFGPLGGKDTVSCVHQGYSQGSKIMLFKLIVGSGN